jgi:hypothetical protein
MLTVWLSRSGPQGARGRADFGNPVTLPSDPTGMQPGMRAGVTGYVFRHGHAELDHG